jgi:hypothetical protein
MNIFKRMYDFLFPIMDLEQRISKWCKSINKDISYGNDMTHDKLDKIDFPKRRFILNK